MPFETFDWVARPFELNSLMIYTWNHYSAKNFSHSGVQKGKNSRFIRFLLKLRLIGAKSPPQKWDRLMKTCESTFRYLGKNSLGALF